jgi:hypothetical protein
MTTTLYAYQGKDFEENALFLDEYGSVKDVAGHTSFLKIAKHYTAEAANKITINGVIFPPSTNGIFYYTASKETILSLDYGSHVYTRYLVDPTGDVVNVVSGEFIIIPSVL